MAAVIAILLAAGRAPAADLTAGMRQVDEGEFEAAVLTLDAVVRELPPGPANARQLAQAYLFLGIAYLGLEQPTAAKGKFHEAVKHDPTLRVSPDRFPTKVVRLFEDARREVDAVGRPSKKGGPPVWLLAAGGAAVAGAGVTLATAGGGEPLDRPVETPTGRIEVLSSVPPPGSTITFNPASLQSVMKMTLSVSFALNVARGTILVDLLPTPTRCDMTGEVPVANLVAGRAVTVTVDIEFFGSSTCSPPFTTNSVQARLMDDRFVELARQSSAATYHFVR